MIVLYHSSYVAYVAYVTNGAAAIANMIVLYDHDDAFLARYLFISAKKRS